FETLNVTFPVPFSATAPVSVTVPPETLKGVRSFSELPKFVVPLLVNVPPDTLMVVLRALVAAK
ncbi:hypothetical protein NL533_35390, partial [Klebsiella pneumoniae]|nr:hypothetical protein [Klebsiella pneumoniae]